MASPSSSTAKVGADVGTSVDADDGTSVDAGGCTGRLRGIGHRVHMRTGIGYTRETALVLETLAGHASLS